jgi:hypothetical protein
LEVGPDAPVRQAAVVGDVEGGESLCVGLGDNQRRIVGRHKHAVGEGEAIGHLARRAIGTNQSHDSGAERLTGH